MISVATARGWLSLEDTEANNTLLAGLIERVTGVVGRELGRYLGEPEATEEIRDGGVPMILLHDDPVLDSGGNPDVVADTRTGPTVAWEEVDDADYVVEGRAVRHASRWPEGRALVRLTYTRGYAPDEGPAELRNLVLDVVTRMHRSRGTNEAMQAETIGDYSYTRKSVMTAEDWTEIARRWRRQPV